MLSLLSLGHRTGLLRAMANAEPRTSEAIAEAAGLAERYVRECLNGLVAAGVVETDPATGHYWLPTAHAARVTDAEGANLAVYAQFLPMLGAIEDDIVAAFRTGEGVPYERYARFHEVMAEDSAQTVLPALIEHILPLAPGLTERLEAGIRVLDAGCGRGLALQLMARRFPRSEFLGYDLSAEAIEYARKSAQAEGLTNIRFEVRDLSDFDRTAEPGRYELVTTFDAIHDQARPAALLAGIRRSLAPDGVYIAQDIRSTSHAHRDRDNPMGAFLYAVSCHHCMPVSLAQGGEGLGTMWGRERALAYLRGAGFSDVQVHELPHDIQNDYFVCRP
ncbi:methyltransferase domain-containing protein [Spiribacter halobius]|nr:methyltransferase domain-containing protein [Spiribacter halobius]UEX79895.1 methyltransferase domain-containing protein [Spiribacter halobius]